MFKVTSGMVALAAAVSLVAIAPSAFANIDFPNTYDVVDHR